MLGCSNLQETEIRLFASLRELINKRGWSYPHRLQLFEPCTAFALAERLELPTDKIEAVFINCKVTSLREGLVCPGDRVGFVPYGTPGAARLLLGIKREDT